MRITVHGGYCCGISHVHDFFSFTEDDKHRLRSYCKNRRNRGGMLEIVLIDSELEGVPGWEEANKEDRNRLKKAMIDLGFEFKTRFYNGNSGNYCNVYHMSRNPQRGQRNPPSMELE